MNRQNQKRLVVALTSLFVAWGGIAMIQARASNAPAAAQSAGPAVDVAEVLQRNITDWQTFSGRLEAIDKVDIRPQVSGVLTAVHFKDGALVKKGDPLFTIDPRPYAAEFSAAEARADYAASELARAERLLAENAIAKRDFEDKKNTAQVTQAALRVAKLNLEYTQIRAPIDGRMSRAEVTIGNLVTANGPTPLTTLVSAARIYAAFDVDEQTFLKLVNPTRTAKGSPLPVHLGLANEEGFPRKGTINSVDNRLDGSSGTIRVRAIFDNAEGQLIPGLYARLRLGGSKEREAVLIDEKAIGTDQDKRFVLVVDSAGKTAYREIQTGALQEGLRVVETGLKAGERIVVNGLQRVHPGDAVTPQMVAMDSGKPVTPAASATATAVNPDATPPAPAAKADSKDAAR